MSRGNSMCGWMRADERGGRFHTDPSGTFIRYEAKAVGSGSEAAQSELQDKWHKVRGHYFSSEPHDLTSVL